MEAFMAEVLDQTPPQAPNETDVAAAVQRVLAASDEPLTPSMIRSQLPASMRGLTPEQLTEVLRRRVEANVLYEYSPYRSPQHRYWDRPLAVHVVTLIRAVLTEGPLTSSQLRRKLPDYARDRAEEVLRDQVQRGELHEHARSGSRTGMRYGLEPPNPREPLRQELVRLFDKLQRDWSFSRERLRQAALELLHEEEWDAAPPDEEPSAEQGQPPAPPQPAVTVNEPAAAAAATARAPVLPPHVTPPAPRPAPATAAAEEVPDRPPEMQP
jgi:hypothetical protein